MNFYSIDFETASYAKHSACSVAIVKVENSRIVDEYYSLIKPETDFFWKNIQIHGIKPEDVADAPKFPDVWKQIQACFKPNSLVVAHNAPFDCGVLAGSLDYYGIEQPNYLSLCTVKTSRKLLARESELRRNLQNNGEERRFSSVSLVVDTRVPECGKHHSQFRFQFESCVQY